MGFTGQRPGRSSNSIAAGLPAPIALASAADAGSMGEVEGGALRRFRLTERVVVVALLLVLFNRLVAGLLLSY